MFLLNLLTLCFFLIQCQGNSPKVCSRLTNTSQILKTQTFNIFAIYNLNCKLEMSCNSIRIRNRVVIEFNVGRQEDERYINVLSYNNKYRVLVFLKDHWIMYYQCNSKDVFTTAIIIGSLKANVSQSELSKIIQYFSSIYAATELNVSFVFPVNCDYHDYFGQDNVIFCVVILFAFLTYLIIENTLSF